MGKASIKFQLLERIDSLKRFGQSKHEAKQREKARCGAEGERWNPAKVDGIFSHKTCDTYKEHGLNFVAWVRETHGVKQLDRIENGHVKEWLERSMGAENSAWTVKVQAASMAKILGCSSKDFGVELPTRIRGDITRSREIRDHDSHFSLKNHSELVAFNTGCGLRRKELTALRPGQIVKDELGNVNIKGIVGKGGRKRDVPVVDKYKDHVWEMREKAISEGRRTVFEKVPNRCDVHSLRREYAMARYKEIEASRDPSGLTYKRRDDQKVFDRAILLEVSENMGHSRENVIVRHYLD